MTSYVFLVLFAVLLVIVLAFFILVLVHRHLPHRVRFWLCEHLGWHAAEWPIEKFDGCNVHAKCSVCGKPVMLDSQGNWF
jgi:hypothetical protein